MEALLPDTTETILLGLIAIAFALGWLARTFPDVGWLRFFHLPQVQMTEAQRAERRRTANRITGIEMILAGFILPLLYIAGTVMMFNDFETLPTMVVGACSLACIAFGIWVLMRS
jgi:uncharacterized membrane protein